MQQIFDQCPRALASSAPHGYFVPVDVGKDAAAARASSRKLPQVQTELLAEGILSVAEQWRGAEGAVRSFAERRQ